VDAELALLEAWAENANVWRLLRDLYQTQCVGGFYEAAWAFGLDVQEITRRRTALAPKGTEP
jgi:hypothetical protein